MSNAGKFKDRSDFMKGVIKNLLINKKQAGKVITVPYEAAVRCIKPDEFFKVF